jgi:hypothetical protein
LGAALQADGEYEVTASGIGIKALCMGLFESRRVTHFSIVVSWFDLARPHPDGFEHCGAVGMTIRGERAFGRG